MTKVDSDCSATAPITPPLQSIPSAARASYRQASTMRLALAFAACAVAFRAPTPPLRQRVTLRAADLEEIRKMRASAIQQ